MSNIRRGQPSRGRTTQANRRSDGIRSERTSCAALASPLSGSPGPAKTTDRNSNEIETNSKLKIPISQTRRGTREARTGRVDFRGLLRLRPSPRSPRCCSYKSYNANRTSRTFPRCAANKRSTCSAHSHPASPSSSNRATTHRVSSALVSVRHSGGSPKSSWAVTSSPAPRRRHCHCNQVRCSQLSCS